MKKTEKIASWRNNYGARTQPKQLTLISDATFMIGLVRAKRALLLMSEFVDASGQKRHYSKSSLHPYIHIKVICFKINEACVLRLSWTQSKYKLAHLKTISCETSILWKEKA